MRVCAFGIITAFWFFDFFFVAGFVLSNSPGFVSVMAVILGLVYTIYGKIKQCKKIDKIRTEGRIDKSYFVSMYTGLTAITNAVFAKTK